jgi:hypothetical protein
MARNQKERRDDRADSRYQKEALKLATEVLTDAVLVARKSQKVFILRGHELGKTGRWVEGTLEVRQRVQGPGKVSYLGSWRRVRYLSDLEVIVAASKENPKEKTRHPTGRERIEQFLNQPGFQEVLKYIGFTGEYMMPLKGGRRTPLHRVIVQRPMGVYALDLELPPGKNPEAHLWRKLGDLEAIAAMGEKTEGQKRGERNPKPKQSLEQRVKKYYRKLGFDVLEMTHHQVGVLPALSVIVRLPNGSARRDLAYVDGLSGELRTTPVLRQPLSELEQIAYAGPPKPKRNPETPEMGWAEAGVRSAFPALEVVHWVGFQGQYYAKGVPIYRFYSKTRRVETYWEIDVYFPQNSPLADPSGYHTRQLSDLEVVALIGKLSQKNPRRPGAHRGELLSWVKDITYPTRDSGGRRNRMHGWSASPTEDIHYVIYPDGMVAVGGGEIGQAPWDVQEIGKGTSLSHARQIAERDYMQRRPLDAIVRAGRTR